MPPCRVAVVLLIAARRLQVLKESTDEHNTCVSHTVLVPNSTQRYAQDQRAFVIAPDRHAIKDLRSKEAVAETHAPHTRE